jgi:hypothetical protein
MALLVHSAVPRGLQSAGKCGCIHGVKRLAKSICVLLVILWVPITSHCAVETVLKLSIIGCCDETAVPHAEGNCSQDECSVVESGLYKIEEDAQIAPVPLLLPLFTISTCQAPPPQSVATEMLLRLVPPEFLRTWRYFPGAAIRAPSLV